MTLAAIDIGGANLKAAHGDGSTLSRRFALWKAPERLETELATLLASLPKHDRLLVTMTGELCDAFESRRLGVARILDALEAAVGRRLPRPEIEVFTLEGSFLPIDRARLVPDLVGAANWLALAMWAAAKIAPGREGFLLDIGSSTTDVCAFRDGRALPRGRADHERLRTGELIYTGVRRTPLCALATRVTVGETPTFIAAELFATTLDLYLLAGHVAEDPKDRDTADGRPATIDAGRARLARMLCADAANLGTDAIARLARAFADAQLQTIVDGARGVIERAGVRSEVAVISGSGEFLARRAAERLGAASILSIAEHLDRGRSEAACAWALIELASR